MSAPHSRAGPHANAASQPAGPRHCCPSSQSSLRSHSGPSGVSSSSREGGAGGGASTGAGGGAGGVGGGGEGERPDETDAAHRGRAYALRDFAVSR